MLGRRGKSKIYNLKLVDFTVKIDKHLYDLLIKKFGDINWKMLIYSEIMNIIFGETITKRILPFKTPIKKEPKETVSITIQLEQWVYNKIQKEGSTIDWDAVVTEIIKEKILESIFYL